MSRMSTNVCCFIAMKLLWCDDKQTWRRGISKFREIEFQMTFKEHQRTVKCASSRVHVCGKKFSPTCVRRWNVRREPKRNHQTEKTVWKLLRRSKNNSAIEQSSSSYALAAQMPEICFMLDKKSWENLWFTIDFHLAQNDFLELLSHCGNVFINFSQFLMEKILFLEASQLLR